MTNPTPPTPQGAAHSPADASEAYSSADCSPGASTRWGLPQFDFGLRLRPARRVRRALLGSVLISSVAFMLVHLYQTPDLTTLVVLGSATRSWGFSPPPENGAAAKSETGPPTEVDGPVSSTCG
jgi:hypothetical protein